MYRVVPAAHSKPHAQQQIARDLEVDYQNFPTNVRGPPDKYGQLTLGRPCVRCYSTLRALSPVCGYVHKIFFFIFRLMTYTDVCFFSLSGVLFPRE